MGGGQARSVVSLHPAAAARERVGDAALRAVAAARRCGLGEDELAVLVALAVVSAGGNGWRWVTAGEVEAQLPQRSAQRAGELLEGLADRGLVLFRVRPLPYRFAPLAPDVP